MNALAPQLPSTRSFRARLLRAMPAFLRRSRWYGEKDRAIRSVSFVEVLTLSSRRVALSLVRVSFRTGTPLTFSVPLSLVNESTRSPLDEAFVVMRCSIRGRPATVIDATADAAARAQLLELFDRETALKSTSGAAVVRRTPHYVLARQHGALESQPVKAEQSNSSLRFGDALMLKLFRRSEVGENPEVELGRAFTASGLVHVPPLVGWLEYQPRRGPSSTLAVVHGFVPNRGDAWATTQALLARLFASVRKQPGGAKQARLRPSIDVATLLGQRTAQMHRALASSRAPAFVPRRSTKADQRRLAASMSALAKQTFAQLQRALPALEADVQPAVRALLRREGELLSRFASLKHRPLRFSMSRCHGDYHLGQVLDTGSDLVITDFEGEPRRPLAVRRQRQSPLRDVAGMLRSFHYAAVTALAKTSTQLEPWARAWYDGCVAAFLSGYLRAAKGGNLVPNDPAERDALLELFMLEKAVYELSYEAGNRPMWLMIPLRGIELLLAGGGDEPA